MNAQLPPIARPVLRPLVTLLAGLCCAAAGAQTEQQVVITGSIVERSRKEPRARGPSRSPPTASIGAS